MVTDAGPDRVVADRYVLRRLLGRGGMGSVWLATDQVLGRDVAVKEVIFPTSLSDEERRSLRERTLREARAAARIEHPQVTTVHDVVEEDGRPWIVMEHVPSQTLSEVLRDQGALPVDDVVRIGLDVLAAIDAAHRAGIVHRDVKPANVLVGAGGRAWLTDFGIATSAGDPHLTAHGVVVGSPSYVAPERVRGEEPGPPADLWALGATLYTAVVGRPPFERGNAMATMLAAVREEVPPAAGPLEPLLHSLLAKDPTSRMTVEEARHELLGLEDRARGPAAAPAGAVGRSVPQGVQGAGPADDDRARAEVGDEVQRIDIGELSAMAAAATKAVAGTAVRHATRRLARGIGLEGGQERRAPAPPDPEPDGRRTRRRRRRRGERSHWFRRRWVVVPLVVLLAVLVLLVASAGVAFEVLLDAD